MIALPTLVAALAISQPGTDPAAAPLDWKALEGPYLSGQTQLTLPARFSKAGEAYFDHQTPPRWVVFQGVERPAPGEDASANYAMYVAQLTYDLEGAPTGLETVTRISPEGSANTCAWFEPLSREQAWGKLIFGSTIKPPAPSADTPGYQRQRGSYMWSFPPEMRVVFAEVTCITNQQLREQHEGPDGHPHGGPAGARTPDFEQKTFLSGAFLTPPNGPGYMAECSWSPKGRSLLYTYVDPKVQTDPKKPNADIWVYDEPNKTHTPLIQAAGYDGGPFFSPDGKWICYRSDRKGDNNLQLFVAELAFDEKDSTFMGGRITGIKREIQLTADDGVVSWCPFWHPSMKYMVYATSAVAHSNYEVFAIEFDPSKPREQLKRVRVTSADGFDGLPVFSDDGKLMMWTSQRGPKIEGEQKPSSQLWVAKLAGEPDWNKNLVRKHEAETPAPH
jgi:TolB protein